MKLRAYEEQYKALLVKIKINGEKVKVRNHYVRRLFGGQLDFFVNDKFPILTSRFISIKTIAAEAKWIMSGDTSLKILRDAKVKIWDGYELDDVGQLYGYNLIHWGESNHDQLSKVIENINAEVQFGYSRRHLLMFHNPTANIPNQVPPPCYTQMQLFTQGQDLLSCIVSYRSTDAFVGLPYDVGVFMLMLLEIAQATGREAHRMIVQFGDVHIYEEHIQSQLVNQYLVAKEQVPPGYIFADVENVVLKDYLFTKNLIVKPLL